MEGTLLIFFYNYYMQNAHKIKFLTFMVVQKQFTFCKNHTWDFEFGSSPGFTYGYMFGKAGWQQCATVPCQPLDCEGRQTILHSALQCVDEL